MMCQFEKIHVLTPNELENVKTKLQWIVILNERPSLPMN